MTVGHLADSRRYRVKRQVELQIDHLEPDQKELTSFHDVFALTPEELETTDLVTHSINTAGHPPIRQPVRRTPFTLRKTVDQLVAEMLKQEVIEPSTSPWASPLVLVR